MLKNFMRSPTVLTSAPSSLLMLSRMTAYVLNASAKISPPRNTTGETRLKTCNLSESDFPNRTRKPYPEGRVEPYPQPVLQNRCRHEVQRGQKKNEAAPSQLVAFHNRLLIVCAIAAPLPKPRRVYLFDGLERYLSTRHPAANYRARRCDLTVERVGQQQHRSRG